MDLSAQRSPTCPVVAAIERVVGGGLYNEEDSPIAKIAGGGADFVCDNVSYFTNLRIIDFARFELARPTLEQYQAKFSQLYAGQAKSSGDMFSIATRDLYTDIINRSKMSKYIYDQFVQIVNKILELEKYTLNRAIAGQNLNMSSPMLLIPQGANREIIYSPELLQIYFNNIIKYINAFNLDGKVPQGVKIAPLPEFKAVIVFETISIPGPQTIAQYSAVIHQLLGVEMELTKYLREVERYHCLVINHTNEIFARMAQVMQ